MSNVTELATGQLTATETQAGAGRSAMNRNTDWTTALLLAWNWGPRTADIDRSDPMNVRKKTITLACLCEHCDGRSMLLTSRLWRSINRLPTPTARRVIHQLLSGEDLK